MSENIGQPKPKGKIAKHLTEQRIIAALTPGYRLVRINWKKHKIHVVDHFGNIKVLSLGDVSQ